MTEPWKSLKEKIKTLSERIVLAQEPIRILDSLKWPQKVSEDFFASKAKEMPIIDPTHYESIPLAYDLKSKESEFTDIIADINKELGPEDAIGKILTSMAEEYIQVIHMLKARGSKNFYEISKKLYGSTKDKFYSEDISIADLSKMLYSMLDRATNLKKGPEFDQTITAEECVQRLQTNLSQYFASDAVQVEVSDGIIADASAGGSKIKIRAGALLSQKEIDILEVHEGWVHIGTNFNGQNQTVAKWLAKGPPRVASTQEGLAQLMEIMTFRSFPERAKKVSDRILAIEKAEDGANFIEVFDYFKTEGYSETECFKATQRTFRGGVLSGGAPFTKDLAYCKGFVEIYNFMRACNAIGKPDALPFLFVGKVSLEDVPILYQKHLEGIIDFPKYLPPMFSSLSGLLVWMSYSSFMNRLDLKAIQKHYESLF